MRLGEALDRARRRLLAAGVESPAREARLLAAHALGVSGAALLDPAREVDRDGLDRLVGRREAREPLAFITGRVGFWTLELEVSPATLVPRADSETVIEAALAAMPDRARVRRILDLGTGTGCLLLAALAEYEAAFGVGVDVSPKAATLAARNAKANGLGGRAAFATSDWVAALVGSFDLVLCNPPYIPSAEIAALMPEVARHEPRGALDGGPDGLGSYARLMCCLPGLLAPAGMAVFEVGIGQAASVEALATGAGLAHVRTTPDLSGIARAIVLQRGDWAGEKAFGSKPLER